MVTNQAIEETLWCRLISFFFSYLFLSFYLAARTISLGSCSPWLVPFHKSQTVERERERKISLSRVIRWIVLIPFSKGAKKRKKKKKKKFNQENRNAIVVPLCERIPVAEKEEKE